MAHKVTGNDLRKLGFPEGRAIGAALAQLARKEYKKSTQAEVDMLLKNIIANPTDYLTDLAWSHTAAALIPAVDRHIELVERKPYKVWGAEGIEPGAIHQMETAMKLPVTVGGALMPDAHQGYGLPIGGVLATDNAVIPYAVGVDIGCRMALSVFPIGEDYLNRHVDELKAILMDVSRFGGKFEPFKNKLDHEVLSRSEFRDVPFLKNKFDKAASQIGTSGGGNHFVEFGVVDITTHTKELGLLPGKYIALLTHSGSRGLGAGIAEHYTKLAKEQCMLPDVARDLAYLSLDNEVGQEYWIAMNLAGDYASACHEQIHKRVAKALGTQAEVTVENHHNFAWKEQFEGREVITHRKGATPAGKGVLGIIPGSMASECYIVSGNGVADSLNSASHGAGRLMSRSAAKLLLTDGEMRKQLADKGITLIGGGVDEDINAYKPIAQVMASQSDLVSILGTFHPRIVRMEGAAESFQKPWERGKKNRA